MPIRFNLLFPDEPRMAYGAIMVSADPPALVPGEVTTADVCAFYLEGVAPKLSEGQTFHFSDTDRPRGEGVVTAIYRTTH
jgi:hypothetical protein